jgi:hypothetical protein
MAKGQEHPTLNNRPHFIASFPVCNATMPDSPWISLPYPLRRPPFFYGKNRLSSFRSCPLPYKMKETQRILVGFRS